MTELHGQKRKEIGEPEDLPDPKRRKIDQKTSDQSKENFELSEDEENLDYHIEDLLAPQEKEFLRQDPFNLNFLATTWTNETTSLKTRSKFKKWIGDWPHTADLAPELLLSIINFCDVDTAFQWRRVSKLTNSLVITSDYLWRNHLYARHWKLRHDLENRFMEVDPKDEDKTKWIHVIPDNEIDWFREYIRNHINAMSIQKLIKDITNKLQKIVDEHFVVKEGYKIYQPGHERLAFFQHGLTDEEIDDRFSSYFLHPISNDLRELLKCCNGARFNMSNREKIFDVNVLPVVFPELKWITKGISYARFEKIDGTGLYSDDSEISEDDWEFDREPLDLPIDPEIPEHPSKIEISASDMASDGDDYEMSDQSESSSEDEEDDTSDDDSYERLSKDWGVFGAPTKMLKFMGEQIVDGDPSVEQLYNMNDGALFLVDQEYYMGLHEMDFTTHSSIVEYLQDISDFLDDPVAFRWVKFHAYELKDQTNNDKSDENLDENDGGDLLDSSEKAEDEQSMDQLHEVLDFYVHDHYTHNYIAPRAVKLAVAAVQDFAVKVFEHARKLEGSEELQPGTFTRAAKELFPKEIFDETPPRERRRKKNNN